ncbi:hypothetical protein BTTAP_20169 [Brochothrix thermosphacta]|nr:hypothetical protein BTTAP_20169 [Brochothrix thermosphacta]
MDIDYRHSLSRHEKKYVKFPHNWFNINNISIISHYLLLLSKTCS